MISDRLGWYAVSRYTAVLSKAFVYGERDRLQAQNHNTNINIDARHRKINTLDIVRSTGTVRRTGGGLKVSAQTWNIYARHSKTHGYGEENRQWVLSINTDINFTLLIAKPMVTMTTQTGELEASDTTEKFTYNKVASAGRMSTTPR